MLIKASRWRFYIDTSWIFSGFFFTFISVNLPGSLWCHTKRSACLVNLIICMQIYWKQDLKRKLIESNRGGGAPFLPYFWDFPTCNVKTPSVRCCQYEMIWFGRLSRTQLIRCCSACVISAQWTGLNNSTLPAAPLSPTLSDLVYIRSFSGWAWRKAEAL